MNGQFDALLTVSSLLPSRRHLTQSMLECLELGVQRQDPVLLAARELYAERVQEAAQLAQAAVEAGEDLRTPEVASIAGQIQLIASRLFPRWPGSLLTVSFLLASLQTPRRLLLRWSRRRMAARVRARSTCQRSPASKLPVPAWREPEPAR